MLTQCCSQDGTRALTIASCQGHAPVVKKLLNAGAHPDLENKVSELPTELVHSADMSHMATRSVYMYVYLCKLLLLMGTYQPGFRDTNIILLFLLSASPIVLKLFLYGSQKYS